MKFREYLDEKLKDKFKNYLVYVNPTPDEYKALTVDRQYFGLIPVCVDFVKKKVYAWNPSILHYSVLRHYPNLWSQYTKGQVVIGYYNLKLKMFKLSETYYDMLHYEANLLDIIKTLRKYKTNWVNTYIRNFSTDFNMYLDELEDQIENEI